MNALLRRRGLPLLDRVRYQALFDFRCATTMRGSGSTSPATVSRQLSVEFIAGYEARRLEPALHAGAAEILATVTGAD